jgi:predicted PurR-regulated permease PerM
MPSTEWSRTTKRLVVVGLVIIFLLVLYVFRDLLPPVAIALVLAYILKPIADLAERRIKLPRTLAVILVFLVILLLFSIIPVTVVPYAVEQVRRLNVNIQ